MCGILLIGPVRFGHEEGFNALSKGVDEGANAKVIDEERDA
jgi:hypothetical protein